MSRRAKVLTGITCNIELMQVALVNLLIKDDFGEWLLAQGGRLDPDFEIGL